MMCLQSSRLLFGQIMLIHSSIELNEFATGVLLSTEWWALEIAIMLAGLLPDSALQLSAMAIYNTTNELCFMVSNGVAAAVSTRYCHMMLFV